MSILIGVLTRHHTCTPEPNWNVLKIMNVGLGASFHNWPTSVSSNFQFNFRDNTIPKHISAQKLGKLKKVGTRQRLLI